ncbi:MAG: hypothetical protein HYV32_00075 [Candidatus Kerfeldbacteria bacterium]|nr:hypothetical protein [Candidatus Kerfeldbacteria bacterium]
MEIKNQKWELVQIVTRQMLEQKSNYMISVFDAVKDFFISDWKTPILQKLEKERATLDQFYDQEKQQIREGIYNIDSKLSQLLDMQLDGILELDEYKQKKSQMPRLVYRREYRDRSTIIPESQRSRLWEPFKERLSTVRASGFLRYIGRSIPGWRAAIGCFI